MVTSPENLSLTYHKTKRNQKSTELTNKIKIDKIKNKFLIRRNNSSEKKMPVLSKEAQMNLSQIKDPKRMIRTPFTSVNLRMDYIKRKSNLKKSNQQRYKNNLGSTEPGNLMESKNHSEFTPQKEFTLPSDLHTLASMTDQVETLQSLLSESCAENNKLRLEIYSLNCTLHQQGIKHDLELSNVKLKLNLMEEALTKSNGELTKLKPLPLLLEKYDMKLNEYQNEIDLRDLKIEEMYGDKKVSQSSNLDNLEQRIQFLIKQLEKCRKQLDLEGMKEPDERKESRVRIGEPLDYNQNIEDYLSSEGDSLNKIIRDEYEKAIACQSKLEFGLSSLI